MEDQIPAGPQDYESTNSIRMLNENEHTPLIDDYGKTGAPEDRYSIAWICCAFLGLGLLFPFNCYIAASDFYATLYPDVSYPFLMSLAYNFFSWVLLFVSLRIMPKFSFALRINSFILFGAAILFIMPFIPSMISQETGAVTFSLILTFLSGCCSSLLFGSIMGLVALYPPTYTGAVMSGIGVAGICASLLRIITKLAMPNTEHGQKASSYLYFFLGSFILITCFFAFQLLLRLPITKFYMSSYEASRTKKGSINDNSNKVDVPLKPLLLKVWKEAFVVFTVFFTTLSLFPGVTGLVENINSNLGQDWFQIIFTSFFMVGDLIGRTAPKWFILFAPKWFILFTPNNLWIPTIARLVFFPLFSLCVKPVVFKSIYIYFTFMFLFALTNGYCGTLAMMFGPTKAEEHEKEVTGIVMSFFLNFGIWVATMFAFLLSYLLTGSTGIHF